MKTQSKIYTPEELKKMHKDKIITDDEYLMHLRQLRANLLQEAQKSLYKGKLSLIKTYKIVTEIENFQGDADYEFWDTLSQEGIRINDNRIFIII